jgi:hypothetical protein
MYLGVTVFCYRLAIGLFHTIDQPSLNIVSQVFLKIQMASATVFYRVHSAKHMLCNVECNSADSQRAKLVRVLQAGAILLKTGQFRGTPKRLEPVRFHKLVYVQPLVVGDNEVRNTMQNFLPS